MVANTKTSYQESKDRHVTFLKLQENCGLKTPFCIVQGGHEKIYDFWCSKKTILIKLAIKSKDCTKCTRNILQIIEHCNTYISQKVHNFLLCLFNHEVNNSQYLMFGSVQNWCALSFCILRGLVTNVTVHRNGCWGRLIKGNGGRRCNTAGYLLCKVTTSKTKDNAWLTASVIVS